MFLDEPKQLDQLWFFKILKCFLKNCNVNLRDAWSSLDLFHDMQFSMSKTQTEETIFLFFTLGGTCEKGSGQLKSWRMFRGERGL